jgi:hypothetical protein
MRDRQRLTAAEDSGRPSLFFALYRTIVLNPRRKETRSLDDRADIELDRLITKRYDPHDGDGLLEPTYAESVRRYNGRRQEEMRAAWAAFHESQAERHRRTLEQLIADHERRAEELCEDEPKGD